MTNEQIVAIVAPMAVNGAIIGLAVLWIKAKFDAVDAKFDAVDARFDSMDRRFDDMRDLWRAELHRVGEVLDARLKHLEER
jgi:hypothetical protein